MSIFFTSRTTVSILLLTGLILGIVGCGGSQMNRLKQLQAKRKAAGKSSGETEDSDSVSTPREKKEKSDKPVNTKDVAEQDKNQSPTKAIPETLRTTSNTGVVDATARSDDPDFLAFKTKLLAKFEERRKELTDCKKIEAVARAFGERVRTKNGYPARAFPRNLNNFSWRVELLPFLGYPELFDRFDLSGRYSSPVNRRLLELMPPEYETLESKTRTNFVVPVVGYSAYANSSQMTTSRIEDGTADTVGVLMIEDKKAVYWTQPVELDVNVGNPLDGLDTKHGFLVVIFGDGRVEKIDTKVSKQNFKSMLSMDLGDKYPSSIVSELVEADFEKGPGNLESGNTESAVASKGGGQNNETTGSGQGSNGSPAKSSLASNAARRKSTNNNISARLEESSIKALMSRDQSAAATFKLASLLVANQDGNSFDAFQWCSGLSRPVFAVKWSVGVLLPEKILESNGKELETVKRAVERLDSLDRPGNENLEQNTGQIGLDSMLVLRKLVNEGVFGQYLVDNVQTIGEESVSRKGRRKSPQQKNQGEENLFDSRKIPDLHYSGIEIEIASSRSYHLQLARQRGNEVLLLFDVQVKPVRERSETRNSRDRNITITTMYVIDVQQGKEIWKSVPMNNFKIEEDRKNALKKDLVFEQMKKFEAFCRDNLALKPLPAALSRDNVLNRLRKLASKSDDNKIPFLAEAQLYLEQNLILRDDYRSFCSKVLGDEKLGLLFATGTPEEKYNILKKYLPINFLVSLN